MLNFVEIPQLVKIKSMYSFIVRKADSKFYFAGESHPFWEMVYVAEGSVGVTADSRVYTLKAGEMIFHKPMEFHRIWAQEGTAPKYCVFSFKAEGCVLEKLEGTAVKCTQQMKSLLEAAVSIRNEAFVINEEWKIQAVKNSFKAFMCISMLESLMCIAGSEGERLSVNGEKDAVLFGRAASYLGERLGERVTVEQVAKHCFVSSSKLKKTFSKYVDCGVGEYFTFMKIAKARRLLLSEKSVRAVSESLGYSSPFYFSSVFKKLMGVTPSQFKRNGGKN